MHVSFISVIKVLATQCLIHLSFISVTEVLVIQWLVCVSLEPMDVPNQDKVVNNKYTANGSQVIRKRDIPTGSEIL